MSNDTRPVCRHCRKRVGCKGRGLCCRCHSSPATREQYPRGTGWVWGTGPRCVRCRVYAAKPDRYNLCLKCTRVPGVLAAHRGKSRYNRRGYGGGRAGARPLPAEPCPYLPGTEQKMAVMEKRAKRGEQVFHPDDARGEE